MKTSAPLTKSPRAVAREALRLAQDALPAYTSARSRKDFTSHQLFAVLALKTFFKTDYRGVAQLLTDLGDLRKDLDLEKVPHLLDPVLRGRAAATFYEGTFVKPIDVASVRSLVTAVSGRTIPGAA